MGRQIVLPYSEIRIANAFKPGVELSDSDIAAMQRRVLVENKEWKRRRAAEIMAEYRESKPKEQKFNSRRKNAVAWGAPISDPTGIWD